MNLTLLGVIGAALAVLVGALILVGMHERRQRRRERQLAGRRKAKLRL